MTSFNLQGLATATTNATKIVYATDTNQDNDSPSVVFKKVKASMGTIETMKYKSQIKKLEIYMNKLIDNGQLKFGEDTMREIIRKTREVEIYAKGIKLFVGKDVIFPLMKRVVRGKGLSLTSFADYRRPIPDSVLKKKKKYEDYFDDFFILHADDKKMVDEEESVGEAMAREKDPILFGVFKDAIRYYFIDDWEDEYCDFTFDDLVDEMELNDTDIILKNNITNKLTDFSFS